ncbi:hypothetical protein EVAR_6431_1 [Eumeta japonica]|uniref:Uncharacterized protein n=1 Tax=Eumeta variegata TaxID=151549 RepID=A0A4C1TDQ3_EUMVA|nr:hypothetical protein EVAR_6431_1 [Eumeta japonica]
MRRRYEEPNSYRTYAILIFAGFGCTALGSIGCRSARRCRCIDDKRRQRPCDSAGKGLRFTCPSEIKGLCERACLRFGVHTIRDNNTHSIHKEQTNIRTIGKQIVTATHGHPRPQRSHLLIDEKFTAL